MNQVRDTFQRPLRDLRISVTDRCNLRCRYCMPEEIFGSDYPFLPKHQLLSFEEMIRLAGYFSLLGVRKIRITGGEPLLRKDLATLIRLLKNVPGIEEIALTTNGFLLAQHAEALKEAGLTRINVSLDSLNDEVFGRINGRGYGAAPVLQGIEAASLSGLKIKINMVVQRGVNEQDILPMARYFRGTGHVVRFIEFMDVGNSNGWNMQKVVTKKEILERIHAEMPLLPIKPDYFGEVADRYKYADSDDEIGIISSVTYPFCASCTRARLSADGHLYTCLFAGKGVDLRTPLRQGAGEEEMQAMLRQVWMNRNDRYSDKRLEDTEIGKRKKIEMSYIGG